MTEIHNYEYAKLLNVTPMTISRWKRGLYAVPENIILLVEFLYRDGHLKEVPHWLKKNSRKEV